MRTVTHKRIDSKDAAELLRELRESVQKSDSDLVGKSVDEVVETTRRVREQFVARETLRIVIDTNELVFALTGPAHRDR
jgi:hypothetical protein